MRDGRLAQVAAPAELYRHPVDVETATSIGEAVILPAEIENGIAACALGRLAVQAGASSGPGEIMVRPEQIGLVIAEHASGTPARVLEVSYFGHDALVRLELSDGLQVTARPAGFAAPKIDQRVRLTVGGPVHAF